MFQPTEEHPTVESFNNAQKMKRRVVTIGYSVLALFCIVLAFPAWLGVNILAASIPQVIKDYSLLILMVLAIVIITIRVIIKERKLYSDWKDEK